jgi:hypothetical protein
MNYQNKRSSQGSSGSHKRGAYDDLLEMADFDSDN